MKRVLWSLGILALTITASVTTILAPPIPLVLIPLWLTAAALATSRLPIREGTS